MMPVVAYILLATETGKEYEVLNEIKGIKGISECRLVYGEYDIFIRIEVCDLTLMDEIVTQVRQIPGITHTTTLVGSP